ncbi:Nucleosome assembly protein 1-like 4 [Myotis davidii]|uniref:Nucleosome assembly protein 1-like 4 n=1 Tax=Myotis davidii TaxID=225400 RepID=L5MD62_MYODS|nr:Nucleosome assembly protein 1-like 4 [Myotis davidii]
MADNSFSDGFLAPLDASATEKLTNLEMPEPSSSGSLEEWLDSASHTPCSYIESLPTAVKRRINALKQLQRLVPRAVLCLMGEAIEDDDNLEEGEEGEEEELEGDEEGEEEDDADLSLKKKPSQPSACKQQ